MNDAFFLSDSEWERSRLSEIYDIVIIGTGFCGYAVAKRALERNPHCRILLVERGPFFLPDHFQNLAPPLVGVLGGKSETFPWTVSPTTATGEGGPVTWAHGMIPFFGGRSTHWSGWCPRPEARELHGWPAETIRAAVKHFDAAENLLGVRRTNQIKVTLRSDEDADGQPIYGNLQRLLDERLLGISEQLPSVHRAEPASIATGAYHAAGVEFAKYSVPGALLALATEARRRSRIGQGAALDIVTECVVQRIIHEDGSATKLATSRGEIHLGDAKLVLAMGSLPPATLVKNSFSDTAPQSDRFSAHFISSVVARIPRALIADNNDLGPLQMAACYIAGSHDSDFSQQFHIQLTALASADPAKHAAQTLRFMPDVKASPTPAQLRTSRDHVLFVCAALGELEHDNPDTWFRQNPRDSDVTTNSLLQISVSESDRTTWDAMDNAVFGVLESAVARGLPIEYWQGDPNDGQWSNERPRVDARRVPCVVHESSTLHIGANEDDPVTLDYRLRGTDNVYVTGGGLWPRGGAAGPTMTMVALALDLAELIVRVPAQRTRPRPAATVAHRV